ncbi:MAG TPA: 1-acyl-sn-glycerol-3-phosphate acyltransferase [bacterium]|nr:1-acyl-sn-glycerol-3-phosphate acyltransferase [bacterium]HPN43707.1 1-acyl-sn-glycerol-3-phosphate acyltransferase [bacterium]
MKTVLKAGAISFTAFILILQFVFTFFAASLAVILYNMRFKGAVPYFVWAWGHVLFFLMGKRLYIYGRENCTRDSNYLVLVNHASLYDIPAVMAVFPQVSWLGREYLTRIPIFGQVLKITHYIPVSRDLSRGVKKIISSSINAGEKKSIAIFPESTRTLDGNIQQFKRGFIHIQKGTKLDILPVTLNGMYRLRPKPRFYINPFTRLEVIIHQPIKNEEIEDKTVPEILEKTKLIIESAYKL